MNVSSILAASLSVRLMLTLGHFLWQGLAVAMLAGLLLILLRRASSHARYVAMLIALVVMAACPVATFCVVGESAPDDPKTLKPTAEFPAALANSASTIQPASEVLLESRVETESTGELTPLVDSPDLAPSESTADRPHNWQRFAPIAVAAYAAGVLILLARLAFGLHGGRRLCRRSKPVADKTILDELARQVGLLGLRVTPAVAWCEKVAVPVVVGVLRPTILLPLSLATGLAPDQVGAILTHELAHIRRYDHLIDLAQRLIEAFLFFHPATWWLSRRIRIEREHCCDDLVVSLGATPIHYSESLLRVAQLSQLQPGYEPVPGIVGLYATTRPSRLRQRIARLLGGSVEPEMRLGQSWSLAAGLLLLGALSAPWVMKLRAEASLAQRSPDGPDAGIARQVASERASRPMPERDGRSGKVFVVAHLAHPSPDDPGSILTVDPEKGAWEKVIDRGAIVRVSHDGQFVAYIQGDGLWIRDLQGNARKTFDSLTSFCWSHDGQYLLCARHLPPDGSMQFETWRVNIDGTPPNKLELGENYWVDDVSPSGEWLVAILGRATGRGCDLYVLRPDGSDRRLISPQIGWNLQARYSPDGKQILYTHHGGVEGTQTQESLWIVDIQGTNRRAIISDPNVAVRGCWSPDGKQMALAMWDWQRDSAGGISGHTNHRIEIVDLKDGSRRRLKIPQTTFWMNSAPDWKRPSEPRQSQSGSASHPVSSIRPTDRVSPEPNGQSIEDERGDEKNGLRTRLVLLTEKPTVGQPLTFRLEMKNFGKVERQFDPQVAAPFRVVKVKKESGEAQPYLGLLYQTAGGSEPIRPGETKVLWDGYDVAENFLLAEPGKYIVQSSVFPSNAVTVELAPGKLPDLKAMFVRMREILPKEKVWRISMSGRVIFFTHSPTNLKKDVTTIQLWFDEKEHPPGYSLGEGENKVPVDRLGKTPLGFAYMTAPPKAAELWPEFREKIREQLIEKRSARDDGDGKSIVYRSRRGIGSPQPPGEAIQRADRWELVLPAELSDEDYARFLDYSRIRLAVVGVDKLSLVSQVSTDQPQVEGREGFDERQLGFAWAGGMMRQADLSLVRKAGVAVTGNETIVLVAPFESEQLLARLERDYLKHAKNHTDMRVVTRTRFEVSKRSDGYEFQILDQQYLGEPAAPDPRETEEHSNAKHSSVIVKVKAWIRDGQLARTEWRTSQQGGITSQSPELTNLFTVEPYRLSEHDGRIQVTGPGMVALADVVEVNQTLKRFVLEADKQNSWVTLWRFDRPGTAPHWTRARRIIYHFETGEIRLEGGADNVPSPESVKGAAPQAQQQATPIEDSGRATQTLRFKDEIVIRLFSNKSGEWTGLRICGDSKRATIETLEQGLKEHVKGPPAEARVRIEADERIRYEIVRQVFDAVKRLGVPEIEAEKLPTPRGEGSASARVRVLDAEGKETDSVYINLWLKVPPDSEPLGERWRDGEAVWERTRNWSPHYPKPEGGFKFVDIAAGEYRVTAVHHGKDVVGRPARFGSSGVVRVEEGGDAEVTVTLAGGEPLVVRVTDAKRGEPIEHIGVRLYRSDGMPIVGAAGGTGNFFDRTDAKGEVRYGSAPIGEYQLEVLGKQATGAWEPPIDWPGLDGRQRVEVKPHRVNAFDVRLEPKPLDEAELDRRWPWSVRGQVTDLDGRPMGGVEVRAHTGSGTLRNTGWTTTDKAGRYVLRFGPGMLIQRKGGWRAGFQAATISVHKPGYFERNLGRDGNLAMADEPPAEEGKGYVGVVLPGRPYSLNFVLVGAAARMSATLVGQDGKPLAGYRVSLTGSDLPPSSSVLASGKTDDNGRFSFTDIPSGYRYQILIEPPKAEPPWLAWASVPLEFREPGNAEFSAVRDGWDLSATQLEIVLAGPGVNWREALKIAVESKAIRYRGESVLEHREADRVRVTAGTLQLLLGGENE
jgi:beta-lactamase regulating signal transducer with metallopeptidase domain/biopolymer transport protein ExbD